MLLSCFLIYFYFLNFWLHFTVVLICLYLDFPLISFYFKFIYDHFSFIIMWIICHATQPMPCFRLDSIHTVSPKALSFILLWNSATLCLYINGNIYGNFGKKTFPCSIKFNFCYVIDIIHWHILWCCLQYIINILTVCYKYIINNYVYYKFEFLFTILLFTDSKHF